MREHKILYHRKAPCQYVRFLALFTRSCYNGARKPLCLKQVRISDRALTARLGSIWIYFCAR